MSGAKNRVAFLIALTAISCAASYVFTVGAVSSRTMPAVVVDDARGVAIIDLQSADTWSTEDRLAIYSSIKRTASVSELDALLLRFSGEPSGTARDFVVASALTRLYEISPPDAMRALSSTHWESRFLSWLFREIAESDIQSALDSLTLIEPSGQKLTAAAAILDASGVVSPDGVDLIASALPEVLRQTFRNDAIAHLASMDPQAAIELVRALPNRDERVRALSLVGVSAARSNPQELNEICFNALSSGERQSCSGRGFLEWVRLDPLAVFDYFDTNASEVDDRSSTILTLLAASDPERGIRLANTLEPAQQVIREQLQAAALLEIAATDPTRAISILEHGELDAIAGPRILESLAKSYAARDPREALDWVETLDSNRPRARAAAVAGISQTDLAQAIQLLRDPSWQVDESLASTMIVSQVSAEPPRVEALARLLVSDHPMRTSILERLVPVWVRHAPYDALTWMNFNVVDSADVTLFRAAARSLAASDVDRAAEYTSLIPALEARREWASAVVEPFARRDPAGAIRWLDTQYGEPWHGEVSQRVAFLTASADPHGAAMLLANSGLPEQLDAASRIAAAWSREEPAAAAQWALTLRDDRSRSTAVTSIVDNWIDRDAVSAERWVMALPRGALRDDALGVMLVHSAANGDAATDVLKGRLFDSFSSNSSRHTILSRIAPALANHDPATVGVLLDAYVTDPNVRRDIEQRL